MKLIIFFFEKSKIFSKIFLETGFYGLDTEPEPKSELELEPEVPQHLVYWVQKLVIWRGWLFYCWLQETSSWRPVIQVRGVAAKLFSVREEMFCQALDTAAGKKRFFVIIDTMEVSCRNVCSVVAVRQFLISIHKFAGSA